MKKVLVALGGLILVLAFMVGCGGSGSQVMPGGTEPSISGLDRTVSIVGVDANSDGVRDDVAAVISKFDATASEKAAMMEAAASVQKSIVSGTSSSTSANDAAISTFTSTANLGSASTKSLYYVHRLLAYTLNTKERVDAYQSFLAKLGTSVIRPTQSSRSVEPGCVYRSTRGTDLCSNNGFVVAYINGIWDSPMVSAVSVFRLHQSLGDSFNGENINYEWYPNPSDGRVADLLEAAKQKLQQDGLGTYLELFWAVLFDDSGLIQHLIDELKPSFPTVATTVESLRQIVRNSVNSTIGTIGPDPSGPLDVMVSATRTHITERKKILLVAHSQGNFFANAIYDQVKPGLSASSLSTLHVATPTNAVRGAYVTSTHDAVIGLVRALTSALPGNVDAPFEGTTLGHGFNEVYMAGNAATAQIVSNAKTELGNMVAPTSGGSSGFFTVTMTWDGTGDVDMHVIEPDGNHVYYSALSGHAGFLDVDNTVGFGPEHYYASCDSGVLQTGTYQIGVNNYSQATGRTATFVVATPDQISAPIRVDVGPERGSSGNGSPTAVLSVRVDRDANGKYTATLVSGRSAPDKIVTSRVPGDAKKSGQ